MMKLLRYNKLFALTYPTIVFILFILMIKYSSGITVTVVGFLLGLMSIQLNFVTSHTWAHALMLEYHMWTIPQMMSKIGQLPIVMFYAFYHHHHTKTDKWLHDVLGYDKIHTLYSHWNSFSLLTYHYPLNGYLVKMFVIYNMYFNFGCTIAYFFGYEFGVFLLPISHDWVHSRLCGVFAYYLLKPLETLGIFATKEDHKSHHRHDHPTVYQNFTSSGIYSKRINVMIDKIWDEMFNYSKTNKIRLYKLMWYPMMGTIICTLVFSTYILMCTNTIVEYFF